MTSVIETVWSVGWLTGVAALLAAIPRLGRLEVVSRLAVVGISLLSAEEPRLSFWSRALIRTQRDRWPGGSGHSAGAGACICSFRFGHRGSFRMVPRRGPPAARCLRAQGLRCCGVTRCVGNLRTRSRRSKAGHRLGRIVVAKWFRSLRSG